MATKTAALITSRDPKGLQLTSLFEATLNKAKLDDEQAQRVIEHGDELQSRIAAVFRELSVSNQFANEEVPSEYGYLSGYTTPKPITDQLAILRQYFPTLGSMNEAIAQQDLPAGSEGWFAIPRWQLIASTYGEAVEQVLDALKKARNGKLENYRKGRLGPEYLRETDRKRLCFERLGNEQSARLPDGQGHDVLVVAAQLGLRHRGRSVRRARAIMLGNEFSLGAFETLIMILTHPERLGASNELWIDCAGDEYSPDADVKSRGDHVALRDGRFESALYVYFGVGQLEFDARWFGSAGSVYGSASAFLPPSTT